MSENALPNEIPLFPLPNVVLFPGALLPLHIFEARYRAMTAEALAGSRVIGMVLLTDGSRAATARAPIYTIGCAGHVAEARELTDGRYQVVLRGLRRFRIVSERLTAAGYRVAKCEALADPTLGDLPAASAEHLSRVREDLEAAALKIAHEQLPKEIALVRERIEQLDTVSLVHALCFGLDCTPVEKQSLLESPDPQQRAELLLRLLEFRSAARRLPNASESVN